MATKKVKITCDCHLPKSEAYGLFGAGKSKMGFVLFVHRCGRPYKGYWEMFLERCPDCFGSFSSPFETLCQSCFKIVHPTETYKGWFWAKKQDDAWRAEMRRQTQELDTKKVS